MSRQPLLPFAGHFNTRAREQAGQKTRRVAIRSALSALRDLQEYLNSAGRIIQLREFLQFSDRFIEAVDELPPKARDAFERRVGSSSLAPLYLRLCKACLTRPDKGECVLDDESGGAPP